jgi:hypothetical protein
LGVKKDFLEVACRVAGIPKGEFFSLLTHAWEPGQWQTVKGSAHKSFSSAFSFPMGRKSFVAP